jgi:hypothetical protein
MLLHVYEEIIYDDVFVKFPKSEVILYQDDDEAPFVLGKQV